MSDTKKFLWIGKGAGRMSAVLLALVLSPAMSAADTPHGDRSGAQVVQTACAACHATGDSDAPKIGDEQAWAELAERGLTGLTASALKGIRNMPAHGGDMTLSDMEIERAITWMVNQSGGDWVEPADRLTPAVARKGEQVVLAQCGQCHETGVDGAPRVGDREAWVERIARARSVDALVGVAIHGHGPMPARGGLADLTDEEIRAAILFMYNPGNVAERGGSR
ncbi:MAG: c-type cytochrome [Gammaproteobacteria bacterium]